MLKTSKNTANSGLTGGCCSGKKNSAQVAQAGIESFPASDPPDWMLGRDEQAASCCQSSKATSARKEKEDRDGHRP